MLGYGQSRSFAVLEYWSTVLTKPRVVYVNHVARLSGGELALLRLITALGDSVEPYVLLAEDGPLTSKFKSVGIPVEVLPLNETTRDLRRHEIGGLRAVRPISAAATYSARLARRFRQLDPQIIHANSLKSGFYGGLAGRLVGTPVLWHVRDRIANDYLPREAVAVTHLALATLPSCIVSNSEATRSTLGSRLGLRRIGPAPVIYDPYRPTRDAKRPSRDVATIGIIGRLAPWKGQDVFLRAFAQAFPDGDQQARVIGSALFGEEVYAANLKQLCNNLGIADRVTFVGFTQDIEGELSDLDVLVHASIIPEPFGQVIVEGLAAGLPVIATAAGGPLEIITEGVDGLFSPPGDIKKMAGCMVALAADPELRKKLGTAGALRAKRYRPEVIGPQMLTLYQDILKDSHPTQKSSPSRRSDSIRSAIVQNGRSRRP